MCCGGRWGWSSCPNVTPLPFTSVWFTVKEGAGSSSVKMSSHSSSRAELVLPVWFPVDMVSDEEVGVGGGVMTKEQMESLFSRSMISSSSSGGSARYPSGGGLTPSYGADQSRQALREELKKHSKRRRKMTLLQQNASTFLIFSKRQNIRQTNLCETVMAWRASQR